MCPWFFPLPLLPKLQRSSEPGSDSNHMYVFFAGSIAFHSPSIARLTLDPFHIRIFEPRQKKKMRAFPVGTVDGNEIEGTLPGLTLEASAKPAPLAHSIVSARGSAARQTDDRP